MCSAATYWTSACETPCPFDWNPNPDGKGCQIVRTYYCASGQPAGEWKCNWQYCPLGYCASSVTNRSACGTYLLPTELCGDGYDNDANGCADDGCTKTENSCTCTMTCATLVCGNVATCDVRQGKVELCGDGKDNNCDGRVDEACKAQPSVCQAKVGTDPILLANRSAVTVPFTDFAAEALVRLDVTRTWSSMDGSFFGGATGIFGSGWRHEWEAALTCSGDSCTVSRGTQEGLSFRRAETVLSLDGAETWQLYRPPSGDTSAARGQLLARRPGGDWILFQSDGWTLHFATACDACGAPDTYCSAPEEGGVARLVRKVDPRGNGVNVSYGRNVGLLLGLTDDLGHTLELKSTAACSDGLARELFFDGMRVATYEYEGMSLLRAVDADGATLRAYVYDQAGTGLLQGVLDEAGQPIAEFAYDANGDAVGIVDEATSAAVSYAEDGTTTVTEYFGTTTSSGARQLDLSGNLLSVSAGCACGDAKTFTWSGNDLVCARDASGLYTYDGRDAAGRVIRHARFAGGSCPPAEAPLGANAEEEWRTYGVVKAVAQGVNLDLDVVTSVSRTSTLSSANMATETWDYDPSPKAYDPLDYACGEAPLPAGAVVCRQITAGYVDAPGGAVLERRATFYSYDGRGRLTRTIGPVNLDRPSASDVIPVEDRLYWGDSDSLARRGKLGELRRYASPAAAPLATTFDYDLFGVYRAWQPDGHFTTRLKDGRGRARFVLESDGRTTETRFHDGEKPRLRLLPGGEVVRTGYDSRGRVTAEERLSGDPDAPGTAPSVLRGEYQQYDPAGNRVHSERRDGMGTVVWKQDREFDVQHRLVRESHPEIAGTARSLEYDAAGFLTRSTDEEGRATSFTPDGLGRVRQVTRAGVDANGATVSAVVADYTYQGYTSALSQVVDGKGLATTYRRDDFGGMSPLSSPNFKGGPVAFTLDARGNLLRRADTYVTVSHTYDGLDRVLTTSAANSEDGSSVAYAYVYDEPPAVGRLTSVVEPERTVSLGYDTAGRLASETMAENGVTVPLVTIWVRDGNGALAETVYPTGLRVQWVRDPATHEVVEVRNAATGAPFATQVRHLPGGPITGLVFGNGQSLSRTFNTRSEPQTLSSGPLGLGYGMSPAGDVRSIFDGSTTRTFQYDFLDRLTASPGWLGYAYDGNGNQTLTDDLTNGYSYSSDRLGATKLPKSYQGCFVDRADHALPVWIASSGATSATCIAAARERGMKYAGLSWYGYCWVGNTLGYEKVSDDECYTPCTANALERCGGAWRNSVYLVTSDAGPHVFGYDRQSNVTAVARPAQLPTLKYEGCYTESATAPALPSTFLTSGATVERCAALAREAGLKYAGLSYYGYCHGGETLGVSKVSDSECNTPCTADPTQRCGGAWRNSIWATAPVTAPGGSAMCLRHDPLGRLVTVGTTEPSSVTPDWYACTTEAAVTSATARFKYDFRNRRVAAWKAETGEWVHTVLDQAGQPLAEVAKTSDPANPWRPVREYVWLDGMPIAQIEHDAITGIARTYAIHVDHIGLPRALTSPTGAVVWSATPARPFGDITETTTPDPETGKTVVTNLRLPGQYDERLLASVGLQGPYYNWNRWYLPSVGRYLELDPIAKAGGFNGDWGPEWYGYAAANPLKFIDPTGLSKFDKTFGLPKKFWNWFHRNEKRCGDLDLTKEEAEDLYKEWKDRGSPRPDKKGNWWEDVLDVIVPLPPLLLPENVEDVMSPVDRCMFLGKCET